jgi:hypothetical protein
MIKRLEANADILSFHVHLPMRKSQRACALIKIKSPPDLSGFPERAAFCEFCCQRLIETTNLRL